MKLFFGNALWHLIEQSDVMTKAILVVLFSVSIFCWALIFYKAVQFNTQDKQLRELSKKLRRVAHKRDLMQLTSEESQTFGGALLVGYIHELELLTKKNGYLTENETEILDMQRFTIVEEIGRAHV